MDERHTLYRVHAHGDRKAEIWKPGPTGRGWFVKYLEAGKVVGLEGPLPGQLQAVARADDWIFGGCHAS